MTLNIQDAGTLGSPIHIPANGLLLGCSQSWKSQRCCSLPGISEWHYLSPAKQDEPTSRLRWCYLQNNNSSYNTLLCYDCWTEEAFGMGGETSASFFQQTSWISARSVNCLLLLFWGLKLTPSLVLASLLCPAVPVVSRCFPMSLRHAQSIMQMGWSRYCACLVVLFGPLVSSGSSNPLVNPLVNKRHLRG